MNKPRVLVVDDEPQMVGIVAYAFETQGFEVLTAYDGEQALQKINSEQLDLVLLDVMLPRIDGFEICRIVRQNTTLPVILLTARKEEEDVIHGLELGADDYMTKPFNPRELVARVRAVLRRTAGATAPAAELLRAGALALDIEGHQATLDGRPLELTPTEFELLAVLLRNPGRAFTRLELLDRVQGDAYEGYERTIDAHIKNLRAKLGDEPRRPRYIQTVFGVGYKLGAEL